MALRRPLLNFFAFAPRKRPAWIINELIDRRATIPAQSNRNLATTARIDPPTSSAFNLMRRYEDLIGLTEVKRAQREVLQAENDFQRTQESRRQMQQEIRDVQEQLHHVRVELDKSSRGEDRYLTLLTKEHALIKEEQKHLDEFTRLEQAERDCFQKLSIRLRQSHEKERERGERTKYWSLAGSAIGAFIGVVGTTINNRMRLREVKDLVEEASDPSRVAKLVAQLSEIVRNQQSQVGTFLDDLKSFLNHNTDQPADPNLLLATSLSKSPSSKDLVTATPQRALEIMTAIEEHERRAAAEMVDIRRMLASHRGEDGGSTVIYVGPRITHLLDQTEKNLETKIKYHALAAVVAVYVAIALTMPIIHALTRGGN